MLCGELSHSQAACKQPQAPTSQDHQLSSDANQTLLTNLNSGTANFHSHISLSWITMPYYY